MNLPDVEAMIRPFLNSRIDPLKTHSKVPADRPSEFVRAWRTGGAALNRILDRPIITVQAWAGDTVRAAQIAGTCRQALLDDAASVLLLVRRIDEVTGLYYDPDPESGTDRYTFAVQLSVRATR